MKAMDLADPLHSLAPNLDLSVLGVLAGTESTLSVTRIAHLAGRGTRQGLGLAVERLVEQGLVSAEQGNRGSLYRLNREHVLADSILAASRSRTLILQRLTEALQALEPLPIHASLFGSFARGGGGMTSDIDLLVVSASRMRDDERRALSDLAERVHTWTGNRLEYISMSRRDVRGVVRRGEPIVDSWRKESVTLVGEPIESLLGTRR